MRPLSLLRDLRTDVRFALRLARHQPGFSISVVVIAALGIAACATTFSLVSGILLSPLPFSAPDRVAQIALVSPDGSESAALPRDDYLRLAAGSPVLDAVATFSPGRASVDWRGEPEQLQTERVTPSFFRVFGVAPSLGRPFTRRSA